MTALVPSLILVAGEAMDPVVLPEATGGNGALAHGLTSDPAGLAGLDFDASSRRLSGTPGREGSYDFTWRADDSDGNRGDSDAAILTFRVTVDDARTAQVRRTVRRTLAAVARRTLTSALENIGSRLAQSVPMSGLTLAGQSVPLGASGPDRTRTCFSGSPGFSGSPATSGVDRNGTGSAFNNDCAATGWSRGVTGDELFGTSAFSLALGSSSSASGVSGAGAPASGGPSDVLWSAWGRGDLGSFEGRPDGMRYEGELKTAWLGVDARSGPWVAGVALSHGTGEADYGFADGTLSGEGRLETELTAVYPYGRWTLSEGLELRGVLGAGSGEATHRLDGGARETSDLTMWMSSVGLRRALPAIGGMDLAARGDASLVWLETGSGPEYVDGLTADSWRVRAGLEASRRIELSGDRALIPFAEAAARQDGGDGLEGTGLEVVGGVRYEAPGLHLEARGRWLAAHTEEGAEEQGLSVTARVGPGAHGRGLSLSLSPRWGAGTGSAGALWRDGLPEPVGPLEGDDHAALEMRIGYGFGVSPYGVNGLLTPFAETALTGEGPGRLRLGARYEASRAALGVELSGERVDRDAGAEHALRLDVRLRF